MVFVQVGEDPRQSRLLPFGAAGVTVRVILQRELAIGAAQFVGRKVRREPCAQPDERGEGLLLTNAQGPCRPWWRRRGPRRGRP